MSFTGSAFRMTHMRAVGGAGVGRGSQGLLELGGGGRERRAALSSEAASPENMCSRGAGANKSVRSATSPAAGSAASPMCGLSAAMTYTWTLSVTPPGKVG